jgi:hypothetical protein
MFNYTARDFSFSAPDGWQDRSIVAFSAPLKPKQTVMPNVVLTCDSVSNTEAASAYADKQLVELAKKLEGFNLSSRRELLVADVPGVELVFTWRGGNGVLKQKQIFFTTGYGLILTFVASALVTDFSEMEPVFQAILDSIQIPVISSNQLTNARGVR